MKFEHETDAAAAHIQKVLRYCPTTGLLFWKATAGRAKAGAEAGNLTHHGYRRVGVLGRYFLAHRIAWLLCTGRWPVGLLDHRDQDKLNNRFENLRRCTEGRHLHRPARRRLGEGAQGLPRPAMRQR